ncbi:MAG TPA: hypothetical protein PLC76_01950, partial [Saprospiraceae bacterium]|nr:hypothetical protein [Saprospiraceae bacterium]
GGKNVVGRKLITETPVPVRMLHLAIEFLPKFTLKLKIKIFAICTSYDNEIINHLPTSERI